MLPFNITNPGIFIPNLLTSQEALFVSNLSGLSYATGDIIYYDGTNLTRLPIGSDGTYLKVASGIPSWAAGGGVSSPLTTKGDLYTYSTVDARLPVGTDGYVLSADSTQTTGLKWIAVSGSGNMNTTTYDPAGIAEQLVGLTATQTLTNKDLTDATNTFPTFNQNTTGNAATATILATGRTIDGQTFNGSANITVIAPGTHAATSKTTPVDADEVPLVDSAASYALKKLTWANIKATLKTYFDTLYQAAGSYLTSSDIGSSIQAYDADLSTIAGLAATTNNIIQSVSSAWASRTPTQVTATLDAMVGDSGSGGTKGLVPAPATGDASKYLKGDGTWATVSGSGGTLDQSYDYGGAGSGRTVTADSGAVEITVPDTSNNVGLIVNQNDATNNPLALEVNGPSATGAPKVTTSTLVQYNDETGSNSDWSFNVAGNGWPGINLQGTTGTLSSPGQTTAGATASSIDTYIYNSTPAQKHISSIYTVASGTTAGSEGAYIGINIMDSGAINEALAIYGNGQFTFKDGTGNNGTYLYFEGTNLWYLNADTSTSPFLELIDGNGIGLQIDPVAGTIGSHGNNDLVLVTGNATTGSLTLTNGTNGNLNFVPNGTGRLQVGSVNVPTISSTDTLSNKTLTKPTVNGSVPAVTADTDGATITFDLSASNIHGVTLGGNRTLALSNVTTNQIFMIELTQDATGSRTVTWFSTIKWAGGTAPTLTTTASKKDTFAFRCTGSGTYDGYVIGQNI
jgi:hypothetical protein